MVEREHAVEPELLLTPEQERVQFEIAEALAEMDELQRTYAQQAFELLQRTREELAAVGVNEGQIDSFLQNRMLARRTQTFVDGTYAREVTPAEQRMLAEAEAMKLRTRRDAELIVAAGEWAEPPLGISGSYNARQLRERRENPWLIPQMCFSGTNVNLIAQYKTGKTTLLINLVKACLDTQKLFLGRYPVNQEAAGRVGFWNGEMDSDGFDRYLDAMQFTQDEGMRFFTADLKGYSVNLLTPRGMNWAIDWLRAYGVRTWIIDSWIVLCQWCGVNDNVSREVMQLTAALDHVKQMAGVETLFIASHTGNATTESGSLRTKGSTSIEAWFDARWEYSSQGIGTGARYIAVNGRDVLLEKSQVDLDEETRWLSLGPETQEAGGETSSAAQQIVTLKERVVQWFQDNLNTATGINALQKELGGNKQNLKYVLESLVDDGVLDTRPGARNSVLYFLKEGYDRFQ